MHETCPYCGKEMDIEDMIAHIFMEHMDYIRKEEFGMLDKMRKEHYEILLHLKRNYPSLFIKFIEELSHEENEEIKIFCMKELMSMREFEKGEKIFRELIERNNRKEIWLEYIIMLNKKGMYEKSIETCMNAIEIFDDDAFKERMRRIIKKARDRL